MIKNLKKCLDVVNVYSSSAQNGNAEFFYITDYKKVIKSNKVWSFEKVELFHYTIFTIFYFMFTLIYNIFCIKNLHTCSRLLTIAGFYCRFF
jgi:hypothetical protein